MGTEATPWARREGTLHPWNTRHAFGEAWGEVGSLLCCREALSQVPLPSLRLLTGMQLAGEELQRWQESIFLPFPSALKQCLTKFKVAKTSSRNKNKSGSLFPIGNLPRSYL